MIVTACWLGAFSVILGAFGAHKLKEILSPQYLNTFETAVRYQFYHVFALALAGILYGSYPHKWVKTAGTCFILGMIFFSGSLYLLCFFDGAGIAGYTWVGAITPLGGLLFILGWVLLGAGMLRTQKQ